MLSVSRISALLECYHTIHLDCPIVERNNVLKWIVEELRSNQLKVYRWNLAMESIEDVDKLTSLQTESLKLTSNHPESQMMAVLQWLRKSCTSGLFILENVATLLATTKSPQLWTALVETVYHLKEQTNTYLILLEMGEFSLSPSLGALIPAVTFPLPNITEVRQILEETLENIDNTLVLAVSGLTTEEIRQGVTLAKIQGEKDRLKEALLNYKIERLQGLGLEFIGEPSVSDFGGMDLLKQGIEEVKADYSEAARKLQIPLPKGWLLVGPPGTGKTFSAKLCAKRLGFPLISVGIDRVKAEGAIYLKHLLQRIEASSPSVCYFDEFDKFFMAEGKGEDSQTRQVLGVLLTWLQEKQSQTFVIATLNRLDALPPELTRAGRFDKIYYVGFPQANERKEIFQLHASRFDERYRREDGALTEREWRILLNKTNYCTGAEIQAIVEGAVRQLFYQGKPLMLMLADFLAARERIIPLYVRDTERVLAMENRAKGISEPVSSPDDSIWAPVATSLWGD